MVVSMAATTAETMDSCWAGQKAALKDVLSVASRDELSAASMGSSTVAHSAARSAVCWVALMAVMWVASMDKRLAELTAASTAVTKAVRRVLE